MIFDAELVVKCNEIIKSGSTKEKVQIKDEVFFATASFPTKITLSMRIRAIADNCECKCKSCGTIHGNPEKTFCSASCYDTTRKQNAPKTDYEKVVKNTIRLGEQKFKNKVEGIDYLVCQICKAKSGDLGSHVHMHGITPAEYKVKYNISALKPQKNRDNRRGDKNPAYQHDGKYSKWSKHFIHGYNENAHAIAKQNHSKFMKESVDTQFKLEYWITLTGSEEEGKKLYKKSQTKNLEWFIEKYGEVEGPVRHLAKTEKWMKSFKKCNFSKISQTLFDELIKHIDNTDSVYYATFVRSDMDGYSNKEFVLKLPTSYIRPDFVDLSTKRIIEFDGDYWHSEKIANPEREKTRDLQIKEAGYCVLHVKEHDYKKDKQKVIQECLNFLKQ